MVKMKLKEKLCMFLTLPSCCISIVFWILNEVAQYTPPYTPEDMSADRHRWNKTSQYTEGKIYYRINTTPEKTGKLPFLENYKNPCWREAFESRSETRMRIRCLPHFYLVGAPKCGTTDLHDRLVEHPLVSSKVEKEPHWLSRYRFNEDKSNNLSEYLKLFDRAVQEDITKIQQNGYYNSIFGDCSASTLWDNSHLLHKDRNMTTPPHTNANVIYNLNPSAKIIIIIRNPITRLYSDYLYFNERQSAEEFHSKVIDAVNHLKKCLKSYSLRYCVEFVIFLKAARIFIGLYHIYIEDFMRVFPRDQIKVLKLEDYSKNIAGYMKDIFKFLGIGLPPDEAMLRITKQEKANENTKSHETTGEMFPKTFEILHKFYKPYNDKLVELLGNEFDYD